MTALFLVGLGGGLGVMARYGIGSLVTLHYGHLKLPLGTFLVNFAGCLLIGVVATLVDRFSSSGEGIKLFWMTGFLGGFTTFSAFGYETLVLARRDDMGMAGIYVTASVVCCLVAVWFGLKLGGIGAAD